MMMKVAPQFTQRIYYALSAPKRRNGEYQHILHLRQVQWSLPYQVSVRIQGSRGPSQLRYWDWNPGVLTTQQTFHASNMFVM